MYLHIGSETIVSEQNLIGIFDLDNTSISKSTREFLRIRQQKGAVITVADDIPKSFVVSVPPVRKGYRIGKVSAAREIVYLSQLAASTLRRRSVNGGLLDGG